MVRRRPRRAIWAGSAGWLLAAATAVAPGMAAAGPDPLEAEVTAAWTGITLRDWSARAGELAGMPVIVDRRLDPDTPVERIGPPEPLRACLEAVAASAGGAVESLDASVRIVPADRAGIASRAEAARRREIARLPAARRAQLAARRRWDWPAGAVPRDLVAAATAEPGIEVRGLDRIPHDHLPAAALPPLSLAERLDLLLAHYDLRMDWGSGAHGTVVAIDAGLPAADPPDRRPSIRRPPTAGSRRFTLRLEAPLEQAVRTIAPQLGLEPSIDRPSLAGRGIHPDEIVRADVKDASRDELLDALVAPLGLRWRIEGARLRIDAPPADVSR